MSLPMMYDSLALALDLLRAHPNWYLFPIRRFEKFPPLFDNNLELASNDPKKIRQWSANFNGPNWGVSIKKSGLIVVDVDTKPGKVGGATLENLELMNGELPETFTVRSPSGGLHVYFTATKEVPFVSRVNGFGKDVDSTNYVVAPGCWLSTGGQYEIIKQIDVAPAPPWFANVLTKDEVVAVTQVADVDLDTDPIIARAIQFLTTDAKSSVLGSNGEFALLMTAAELKDMGVTKYKAIELLAQYYNVPKGDGSRPYCDPLWAISDGPLADRLDAKVENAWNYLRKTKPGANAPEADFTMLAGAAVVDADIATMQQVWRANPGNQPKPPDEFVVVDADPPKVIGIDDFGQTVIELPAPVDQELDDFGQPVNAPETMTLTDVPLIPTSNLPLLALDKIDESKRPGRIDVLCNQWVWIVGMKRFVNRLDPRKQWDTKQFDSAFNYLIKGASLSSALFKDRDKVLRSFHHLAFRPGKPETYGIEYNVWRGSKIGPIPGDTTLWDEHMNNLFQDEDDRDAVLNWMAWIVQNPSLKPNHALLIVGRQTGTGKSFVARVMERIIGEHNTQRPKNSSMGGDFNSWIKDCRLCIVEEVHQTNRRENFNAMRDLITEPRIEVNMKGIPAFVIPNYVCMLGVTNHPDALPLDENDRRWLIVETFASPKGESYYKTLFQCLPSDTGGDPVNMDLIPAVYDQLLRRDLKGYSGFQRPKVTAAKTAMIEQSRSDADAWLIENAGNPPLSRKIVTINDVIAAMPNDVARTKRLSSTIIPNFLRDKLGGERTDQRRLSNGTRLRLWVLRNRMSMIPDDQIVTIYERELKAANKIADEEAVSDFGVE